MAHNFKINIHPTIDNLYIRLVGDFDGPNALQIPQPDDNLMTAEQP